MANIVFSFYLKAFPVPDIFIAFFQFSRVILRNVLEPTGTQSSSISHEMHPPSVAALQTPQWSGWA